MAQRRINFDKTEIVAGFLAGKRFKVLNLAYSDIQRIQFDACMERRLLSRKPSEKITIVTGKSETPIVYSMLENRRFWEEYKAGFEKFADNNHITFKNNLEA